MSVLEYAVRFCDLARHAPALVATVRERVRRFIEGLRCDIWFSMARELESDVPFQQVVGIARRCEGIWDQEREHRRGHEREGRRGQEREDRKSRRPHRPKRYTGPYFGGRVQHGRGFVGHPVQFAVQASHGVPSIHGSQITRTAQFPQPHQQRGCFKCGDTSHRVRDCPRLLTNVSQRGIRASRGRPRGGDLAR
ncbi:uncharacterized protein [Nicotiana tomentosiformis]|uniref:uncharacterized protein n=1 Tax=Nicotiana tomentosiformis TaxID=4098 RepID=UPI00388CA472